MCYSYSYVAGYSYRVCYLCSNLCTSLLTIVIVQITGHPVSVVVNTNSVVTLSCKATGSDPIRYQWRRVNGQITSDRAEGVNTSTLTISSVTEQDEDEYYCVASNRIMDGLQYSDISDRAIITLYGKQLVIAINYLCWCSCIGYSYIYVVIPCSYICNVHIIYFINNLQIAGDFNLTL